jgi:hypothetical protein
LLLKRGFSCVNPRAPAKVGSCLWESTHGSLHGVPVVPRQVYATCVIV